jgi:transposase InsO family protein
VSAFIDSCRARFGVEPICRVLGVSASAYYQRATGQRSRRAVDDQRLLEIIEQVQATNYYAYGYRRTWKAMLHAGEMVGRDHVKRLMAQHGIQGAKRRGKPWRTTTPDPRALRAPDLESFVDSFKTELITDRVWQTRTQLELAIVEWVAWFNDHRLHSALGDLPPIEVEAQYAASARQITQNNNN